MATKGLTQALPSVPPHPKLTLQRDCSVASPIAESLLELMYVDGGEHAQCQTFMLSDVFNVVCMGMRCWCFVFCDLVSDACTCNMCVQCITFDQISRRVLEMLFRE